MRSPFVGSIFVLAVMILSKYIVAVPDAFASRLNCTEATAQVVLLVSGPLVMLMLSTARLSGFPLASRFVFRYRCTLLSSAGAVGLVVSLVTQTVFPPVCRLLNEPGA